MAEESGKKRRVEDIKEHKFDLSLSFIDLLLKTKAEDFALDRPKKDAPIFICYKTDLVVDVWKGLIKHNFLSCPVILKSESKYYGFIDMIDIVNYVINHFGSSNILGKEKDFWEMVDEEKQFSTKTVKDVMVYPLSRRNPFHPVAEGYSAFAVVEPLAREHSLHRVPIVNEDRKMTNLVTQSQVMEFIRKHILLLGPKANKPIALCLNFLKPVISVDEDAPAIDAFNLMIKDNITGVAVTNKAGSIVGNLSIRDIKLIGHDARLFWRLSQSTKVFLAKLQNEWQSRHARPQEVAVVVKEQSLKHVIDILVTHKIHRVFIVDNERDRKPIGVVSLKDVLSEILS